MLRIKSVNESPQKEDGFRILIDESWPNELSKEDLPVDLWLKEIETSNIQKQSKKLQKFPENNQHHCDINQENLLKIIRNAEKENGTVTFLYSRIQSIKKLQF